MLAPAQRARFLGIEINSINLQLRLPKDKIVKLKQHLGWFLERRNVSRKDLERLGGRLAHCAMVVWGVTPSRRGSMTQLKKPFYKFRLNEEFKSELRW